MSRFPLVMCIPALALVLAAGCGGSANPSAAAGSAVPGGSGSPAGSTATPTAASTSPGATAGATDSSPGAPPSIAPLSPAPGASGGGSAACSGNHDNHVFFDAIAGQVQWDVYCAVLPEGWFVDAGTFQLKDGGRLEITYKGPNGARLTLQEGNVCTEGADACAPHDRMLGPAVFGDRPGNLAALGGGFAIYVDSGDVPSWSALGTGLDQVTFTGYAAALVHVAP